MHGHKIFFNVFFVFADVEDALSVIQDERPFWDAANLVNGIHS